MGKALEKQIKTIEDQGEKEIDALKDLKPKAITYKSDDDDKDSISKDIYNEILEERIDEILQMGKEISHNDLVYDFKGPTSSINLGKYGGPMYIYRQMKDVEKTLQQVEEEQRKKKLKNDLREIASGNPKHKSEKQSYTIKNVRNLYNSRQKIIDLLNDNAKITPSGICRPSTNKKNKTEETALKILTPKQILQRLLIALAQVKAGNNSESLLNEIRQIVYSLYQSKQMTEKVYNHIIESIQ